MHQKGRKKKNSRPDLWDESEAASLRGATHIRYQRVPFVPSVAGRGPHPSPDRSNAVLPPPLCVPGFQPAGPVLCPPVCGVLCALNAVLTTWNYIRNFHVRQVVQENAVTFSREKAAFMEKQPFGCRQSSDTLTEMQALRLLHYLSPKTALFTFKAAFRKSCPLQD